MKREVFGNNWMIRRMALDDWHRTLEQSGTNKMKNMKKRKYTTTKMHQSKKMAPSTVMKLKEYASEYPNGYQPYPCREEKNKLVEVCRIRSLERTGTIGSRGDWETRIKFQFARHSAPFSARRAQLACHWRAAACQSAKNDWLAWKAVFYIAKKHAIRQKRRTNREKWRANGTELARRVPT